MESKLRKIISEVFGLKEDEINDETSMENVEGWDSLSHLRLIMTIEEQYGVTLTEDDMIKMTSISEIEKILKEKTS